MEVAGRRARAETNPVSARPGRNEDMTSLLRFEGGNGWGLRFSREPMTL